MFHHTLHHELLYVNVSPHGFIVLGLSVPFLGSAGPCSLPLSGRSVSCFYVQLSGDRSLLVGTFYLPIFTTFNDGCLGSDNDEGRSEVR